MKYTTLTTIMFFIAFFGQAQSNVQFDKVIRITVACYKAIDLEIPPNNPKFIISNAGYVTKLANTMRYWDEAFDRTFTKTLVIYEGDKIDSVLVVENPLDSYRFKRENGKWLVQNFEIRSTQLSLNHIKVGLTSKEVFKILDKKNKTKVNNGQLWLLNEAKTRLILTFLHDRVVSMKM